jgi:hypothetical protein
MWTPDRADLCEELAGEIGDEDTGVSAVVLTMNAPPQDEDEPPEPDDDPSNRMDDEPAAPPQPAEEVLTPEEEPVPPIHTVPASRLSWGKWDAAKQKHIGEGDIHKAYSADIIANGKIRGVITIEGKPYTVTGQSSNEAHLWPLLTPAEWGEKPTTTYADMHREEFTYEGIRVKRGKDQFVMGPRSGEISVRGDEPDEPAPTHAHATREEERICEAEQEAIANGDEEEELLPDEDDMDDPDYYEPEEEEQPPAAPEEVLTLAPTAAIPAQQMSLFASGEEQTQ